MTGFLKAVVLIILALFVAILAFAAGFGTNYFYSHGGAASPAAALTSLQPPKKFGLMWEAWKILKDKFYYDIPAQNAIVHGMIRGSLASLNDPYSILVEPAPAQQEATKLQGNYGGICATEEFRQSQLEL